MPGCCLTREVSFPLQRALLPFVQEPNHQDAKEDDHRHESEQADLPQEDGTGKKKRDLENEQDEEDRH